MGVPEAWREARDCTAGGEQSIMPLQTRHSSTLSLGLVTVRRSCEDVAAVVGRRRLSGLQDLLSSLHAPLTLDEFGHARLVVAAAVEVLAATVRHFRALRAFLRQERHSWRPERQHKASRNSVARQVHQHARISPRCPRNSRGKTPATHSAFTARRHGRHTGGRD